ncbi:hypothetical protein FB451DRAFT_1385764 [Mycena latifolia]|nr:hypothetical protein FB451DRAFT_1385764 [Mycena latifolia]
MRHLISERISSSDTPTTLRSPPGTEGSPSLDVLAGRVRVETCRPAASATGCLSARSRERSPPRGPPRASPRQQRLRRSPARARQAALPPLSMTAASSTAPLARVHPPPTLLPSADTRLPSAGEHPAYAASPLRHAASTPPTQPRRLDSAPRHDAPPRGAPPRLHPYSLYSHSQDTHTLRPAPQSPGAHGNAANRRPAPPRPAARKHPPRPAQTKNPQEHRRADAPLKPVYPNPNPRLAPADGILRPLARGIKQAERGGGGDGRWGGRRGKGGKGSGT